MPKEITVTAYTIDELTGKSKEKAMAWYRDGNDMPFLEDTINTEAEHFLKEAGIECYPAWQYAKTLGKDHRSILHAYYSLGYSQGDGLCLVGDFIYKEHTFRVKHTGRYYHVYSVEIELISGPTIDDENIEEEKRDERIKGLTEVFTGVYRDICGKVEKSGYAEVDYQNSDEAVLETIRANEYLFTENGSRCAVL